MGSAFGMIAVTGALIPGATVRIANMTRTVIAGMTELRSAVLNCSLLHEI